MSSFTCNEAGCSNPGKVQVVGGGGLCQFHYDEKRFGTGEAERLRARRILKDHRVVAERAEKDGVVGYELRLPPGTSMSMKDFLQG